jgi:hypothetical protein
LKILVKHVLAIAILIPLFVLVVLVWLSGRDPMAALFVLFPLLLVTLLFVKPLNKSSALRFRSLANLLGGILPLASLFLPYLFLGDYPWYPLNSYAVSQGVPQLIVVGSIMTFFSRFGTLVTVAGLWDGSSVVIPCPAFGCYFTLGPGYWLGLTGATLSLLGRSWIAFPKSVEGQRVLGSIMVPAGVIVAILGVLLPYDLFNEFGPTAVRSPVFIFTGFLLCGAGLNLFFRLESTTMSGIRKALQKPLW